MFTKAIVRRPCKNMVNGITSASLGKPDYDNALKQHDNYIKALEKCGIQITVLEADEQFPDSVFVEDTALLTTKCAVITNPGAKSRAGEISKIEAAVRNFYPEVERITSPGTLDAGDVMMVGNHFYIGLSDRTNIAGANQLIEILEKNGLTGSTVSLKSVLHLKTGISYIENNYLLASGEFIDKPEFKKFNIIQIPSEESYASNSLWVNDNVLVPMGFPKTKSLIESKGIRVIDVDVSEYRKLDGGLSCLSLRF